MTRPAHRAFTVPELLVAISVTGIVIAALVVFLPCAGRGVDSFVSVSPAQGSWYQAAMPFGAQRRVAVASGDVWPVIPGAPPKRPARGRETMIAAP